MKAKKPHPDSKLIESLGGPASVVRKLGWEEEPYSIQRVQNWKTRGIPPAVRLARLDLFGAPKEAA